MKTSIKSIFIFCLLFIVTISIKAQVGVGTSTPEASAKLEISSTTKGFLPPRMTYAQRNAITSPAIGLMVYCTNCGPGTGEPQFYNGSSWVNMIGGTGLTQPPTVGSTTAATSVTKTSLSSGGDITNDFGNTITARGVCWSTTSSPTIANSKTTESGTTGSFTSNITGLSAGITYYIRAYATNASGTSYGNQITVKTIEYVIGDSELGGKIAYILQPGDPGYDANTTHGLVATIQDISSIATWGCVGIAISGADGTAIGTGNQNTIDITAGCSTAGIAARICADLVEGGYSDWYLPSKNELAKLYINKIAIGNFTDGSYWSSTETNANMASVLTFSNGSVFGAGKHYNQPVRAIRAF